MLKRFAIVLALTTGAAAASSLPPELSGAQVRGEATFRFLGIPIYDARLYTKGGAALDWNEIFGVELTYRKNLTQYDLVESTMREFDRTGNTAMPVRDQLEQCFGDVKKGDRFLAVTEGPNKVGFWFNGRRTCTLNHPKATARFMGIFLGDNTRSKSFTRNLKGE